MANDALTPALDYAVCASRPLGGLLRTVRSQLNDFDQLKLDALSCND